MRPRSEKSSHFLRARTLSWSTALAAYLVVSLTALARIWTVRASPIWDAYNYFYPAFAYLANAVRHGRLPLWNPYTNCGMPFHADPQAATLNPIALVLALAIRRDALGFILFWVAHWVLAGAGMFVVARALRATPAGALVAALAYAFSGFFLGHAQHTSWIVTAAWLPWAIGLAHLAVATGRRGFALLAGAALGLSALGGYPPLVAVAVFVLACWLALAFLGPWGRFEGEEPSRGRRVRRVVETVAIATGILVLVWSPVLHAFLAGAGDYTERSGPIAPELATSFNPFSLRAAISLLFPYMTVAAQDWIGVDVAMNDAYVGLLSLPLAAVALTTRRPARRLWWLVGLAAFMFAVSLGGGGRLRLWLHEVVPAMKYMRHNSGYRVFWILPLAAAAGVGFSLVATSARARARMRGALGVTAAAAIAAGVLAAVVVASGPRPPAPGTFLKLYVPPVVVLSAAALVLRRWRAGAALRWAPATLVLLLAVDVATHLHFTSMTVLARRRWIKDAEALPVSGDPAAPRQPGNGYGAFNAHQIARFPVVQGYVTMSTRGFNDVLLRGRYAEVLMAHRYWLSSSATLAGVDAEAIAGALAGRGKDDPVSVYVDRAEAALPGDAVVPGSFGSARIVSYAAERVELEVDAPAPAVLASTERFARGWRVRIDGTPATSLRVNAYFRGVLVPAGRHAVTWVYEPGGWWALVAVAAFSLAASLAGGVAAVRPRRAPRSLSAGASGAAPASE